MSKRANFYLEGGELLAQPYHYIECGLDNIFLLNGVSETETTYGPMVHVENINGLHHAIGLHIVEKNEPMTGPEFRFLRKQMTLTQAQLANRFGVTDQTIANYEKEKSALGVADTAMRLEYLLSALPEDTRTEVLKLVLRPPAQQQRGKLPDLPRRLLVDRWLENDRLAA